MSFVRGPNPIWYLPDLVGEPLNDEYYAFFLTNTLPYLPQNVYRDPLGQTVWTGNIVEFLPNGTLPNNLYFDPNLVYRIEVRHGNSQSDALIYEVDDYVPDNDNSIVLDLSLLNEDNQASNPQFAQVNFTRPPGASTVQTNINAAGSYAIAPGWFLDLTGAGTAIVQQIIYAANQNTESPFNPVPPYALRVNTAGGWTGVVLRQRFNGNGGIWVNGAISMSVLAIAEDSPHNVSLVYQPEIGGGVSVASGIITQGAFQTLGGVVNVGSSSNSNLSNVTYTDMEIVLPTTGIMQFSNFQVVGQEAAIPTDSLPSVPVPPFQQESNERSIDHLFHYYASQLLLKPKKSLLTGWNFPLNPYQFITSVVGTQVNMTEYAADQTIVHQEAASQIQTGRNTDTQREGFVVKAVTGATQTRFALIQYIDATTIRPYWSYILSSLVRARIVTDAGTIVGLKARLIWRTTSPSAIGNAEPISSWPVGSDPVFAAGWTAIAPINDPSYILDNAYSDTETPGGNSYPAYAFEQFALPNASTAAMMLGIVIYTTSNLNAASGHEDSVEFDKISLIPSKFAADALPQTYNECLADCQFYYESSYNQQIIPGSAAAITDVGERMADTAKSTVSGSGFLVSYPTEFTFAFNTIKRATPTVTLYSPSAGTADRVDCWLYNNGVAVASSPTLKTFSSFWTAAVPAHKSFESGEGQNTALQTDGAVPTNKTSSYIVFHYTADARMGV